MNKEERLIKALKFWLPDNLAPSDVDYDRWLNDMKLVGFEIYECQSCGVEYPGRWQEEGSISLCGVCRQ